MPGLNVTGPHITGFGGLLDGFIQRAPGFLDLLLGGLHGFLCRGFGGLYLFPARLARFLFGFFNGRGRLALGLV